MLSGKQIDKGRFLINAGLAAVVLLLLIAMATSIYQMYLSEGSDQPGFWRDPQIIAVVIGLVVTILFIDRWRSLEAKVDNLFKDQNARLERIQEYSKEHVELQVGHIIDKADKLSANLSSVTERHPWLEVITEREIIVESESVRGIIRSAYVLLNEGKASHLYEFLEYCARKGTKDDPRKDKKPLRGTAEDFLELALFCEVWLEDFALSTEFLRRYFEQAGASGYVLVPDFIKRLIRVGNLPLVREQSNKLKRIMNEDAFLNWFKFLTKQKPISDRFKWHAANVLSLGYSVIGEHKLSHDYQTYSNDHHFSKLFPVDQALFCAELLINEGKFSEANRIFEEIANDSLSVFQMNEKIILLEKTGGFVAASVLRSRLNKFKIHAFGDDHFQGEAQNNSGHSSSPYEQGGQDRAQNTYTEESELSQENEGLAKAAKEESDKAKNEDSSRPV